MSAHTAATIAECKSRLLAAKQDLLLQLHSHQIDFSSRDFRGDEADLSVSMLNENQLLAAQKRYREKLLEIEYALARIERNQYGYCEETEELIEVERLLAIPWTRLSIEGAEIRESLKKRSAGI